MGAPKISQWQQRGELIPNPTTAHLRLLAYDVVAEPDLNALVLKLPSSSRPGETAKPSEHDNHDSGWQKPNLMKPRAYHHENKTAGRCAPVSRKISYYNGLHFANAKHCKQPLPPNCWLLEFESAGVAKDRSLAANIDADRAIISFKEMPIRQVEANHDALNVARGGNRRSCRGASHLHK